MPVQRAELLHDNCAPSVAVPRQVDELEQAKLSPSWASTEQVALNEQAMLHEVDAQVSLQVAFASQAQWAPDGQEQVPTQAVGSPPAAAAHATSCVAAPPRQRAPAAINQ